jgi:GTP-binding protein
MKKYQAQFVQSNTEYEKCPQADMPEYAFIGRSNVGKSSLINSVLQQKNLAKTSQTPGKTKLINHFLVNNAWYLVDLPGYGFAKVSKSERVKFEKMIFDYLTYRQNLVCTFVLIDVRHAAQKIDLTFMQQLGQRDIPFYIVFTKSDKLSKTQLDNNLLAYQTILLEIWEELPKIFVTSAEVNLGREEILHQIEGMNPFFVPADTAFDPKKHFLKS